MDTDISLIKANTYDVFTDAVFIKYTSNANLNNTSDSIYEKGENNTKTRNGEPFTKLENEKKQSVM